jgi:rubrerythrin
MLNEKNGNTYKCEVCGFVYKEKEWAEKCAKWCKEHGSCSMEITKHAIRS